jgi:DNA repair exonuclease SbcCD nuclease subunit
MTRVIHTGDTHIGYRQYHSPERRRDFLAAFRRVVEDAVEQDVDAVVHAGDLFHDRRPDLGDLLGTISVLRELRDADVPFLAIVGNHESTRTATVYDDGPRRDAQWLDLFETLGLAERLDASGRRVGDAVLYGLDHVPASQRDNLDYEFEPRDADCAALVSHGLFTPFEHGRWEIETVLSESNVEFDAVLLGDNHDPGIKQVEGTWVTYCGSTERASAAERAERGYNLVEFADGDAHVSRKGIETREFVFVDVELQGSEGVGYVRDRVREEDVADAVVVVTVEGDGGDLTPAEIEAFGDEQGALVTRVNDRRELPEPERGLDVQFADPDRAVRERVRELGLSEAAHTVDETVRSVDIADTNVRERVRERVDNLLDDDRGAFERVPKAEGDGTDGETDGEGGEADDERADAGDRPAEPEATDGEGAAGDATADDEADASADGTADGDGTEDSQPNDGQVTMEDYL